MASCRVDQKRALTEHFTQQAVIKFCAKVARRPQKHGNVLVIIIVGMRVLGGLFLTGTSDFGKVVWTSATISGIGRPRISSSAKNVQITASSYTVPE